MKFKLQKLSRDQRLGWMGMSATCGVCFFYFAIGSDHLDSPDLWVPIVVFTFCWLIMIGVFRLYIQDKDPLNFWSLLGFKRKKQSD